MDSFSLKGNHFVLFFVKVSKFDKFLVKVLPILILTVELVRIMFDKKNSETGEKNWAHSSPLGNAINKGLIDHINFVNIRVESKPNRKQMIIVDLTHKKVGAFNAEIRFFFYAECSEIVRVDTGISYLNHYFFTVIKILYNEILENLDAIFLLFFGPIIGFPILVDIHKKSSFTPKILLLIHFLAVIMFLHITAFHH